MQGRYERCEFINKNGSRCKRKKWRTIDREKLLPKVMELYPQQRIAACRSCMHRAISYGDPNLRKRPTGVKWAK